jgi:8-oxo-dGTP pyrophosphatase MutT (NUDIX family)
MRFVYKLITPLRKLYWFVVRPRTTGVKAIVLHGDAVLMIRNAYGMKAWTFPGGGVGRNESPSEAIIREVQEEVGIGMDDIAKIGELFNEREYKRDTVHCFVGAAKSAELAVDPNEILEARWFDKNRLPSDISSVAQEVVSLWLRG